MEIVRKYSKKREAILNAIRCTDTHPTAEWVYNQVKPLYPDLSLGTVYRNLALFQKDGDIVSVGTVNGQERFDAITNSHPHFICESCGNVIDVHTDDEIESAYHHLQKGYGLEPSSHSLTFYGCCNNCKNFEKFEVK